MCILFHSDHLLELKYPLRESSDCLNLEFSIQSFVQDEREVALEELKTIELKHSMLKVFYILSSGLSTNQKIGCIMLMQMHDKLMAYVQDEMGLYADNDPAALEAMSKNCNFFLSIFFHRQLKFFFFERRREYKIKRRRLITVHRILNRQK